MLKAWRSGVCCFRFFPVCFFLYKVLFFEPQLYYGTLHWTQMQTLFRRQTAHSSGLASRAFWSLTAWIWKDHSLLCLCSHCLAQSHSAFDNNNFVGYSWVSQSQKFGIFLLLTFLTFGRAVVAKLGYSWNF